MAEEILLEMENVTKTFPGVRALDGVSLTVRHGTVHALMGENGAGKSTLMKCLFGIYSKDTGRIFLEGEEVSFKNPKDALMHGVAMALRRSTAQPSAKTLLTRLFFLLFPRSLLMARLTSTLTPPAVS